MRQHQVAHARVRSVEIIRRGVDELPARSSRARCAILKYNFERKRVRESVDSPSGNKYYSVYGRIFMHAYTDTCAHGLGNIDFTVDVI